MANARIWSLWLCTPPLEVSPIKWARPPARIICRANFCKAGISASSPEAQACERRGKSCRITRPAPMVICPTSELPGCPSGRPTAISDAAKRLWGHSVISRSKTGLCAFFTALYSLSSDNPQPSIMHRTTGLRFAIYLAAFNFFTNRKGGGNYLIVIALPVSGGKQASFFKSAPLIAAMIGVVF